MCPIGLGLVCVEGGAPRAGLLRGGSISCVPQQGQLNLLELGGSNVQPVGLAELGMQFDLDLTTILRWQGNGFDELVIHVFVFNVCHGLVL